MRSTDRSIHRLTVLIAALLGLGMLAPAAGAAPLADTPGTPCQQGGWVWMAPADTPDIAFLSEEACASAIAQGIRIVPITIPPDGPPPIGAGACTTDACYTNDRDGDGAPDFRDAAPDDPNVTISADCTRVMADRTLIMFANLNLVSCDLSGRVMTRADFSGANLNGANLSSTYLGDANLTRASLNGANLYRANLTRAVLIEATLVRADLTGAVLVEANLSGAFMVDAHMGSVDLRGANLTGADLTRVFMDRSTLEGANLTRTNFTAASLKEVNLRGANLTGAYLWETNLRSSTADRNTNFTNTTMRNNVCPSGFVTTVPSTWGECYYEYYKMDPY